MLCVLCAGGGAAAINDLTTRYGVDIIGTCAFGCEAGALRDPATSSYMTAVASALRFGPLEGLATFALMFCPSLYQILRVPLFKEWRGDVIKSLLRQAAQHREKEPPRNKDIFDQLLLIRREGGARGVWWGWLGLRPGVGGMRSVAISIPSE